MSELEPAPITLFTFGYGNLGFEQFISRVREAGFTHLVDIRSTPGSKYWGDFCRPRLDELVDAAHLKYIFMGDTLGAKVESLAQRDRGLTALLKAASDRDKKICLMCGCGRPENCHRGESLGQALFERGIDLVHLLPHGGELLQSQIQAGANEHQTSLFG